MNASEDGEMAELASALEQLIDIYCTAWSEPDAERRRAILGEVWAVEGSYTDPTVRVVGIDDLVAHIGKVVARRPGARVVRTSRVDAHHNMARFAWQIVDAERVMLANSVDLVELSDDGRIQGIVGYFGPLS